MICKRRSWSVSAEAGLLVSAGSDMAIIRAQVKAGQALLYYLENENGFLWFVVRLDSKTEVCVVCAEGSNIKELGALIVASLKNAGYGVRIHVTRPGMIRKMEALGFQISEYVMRV